MNEFEFNHVAVRFDYEVNHEYLIYRIIDKRILKEDSIGKMNMTDVKIVIEKHSDGYVGYPLGFRKGAIVGQGDTYAEALKDTESAIGFFIEHYGKEKNFEHLELESPALEAYIAVAGIAA